MTKYVSTEQLPRVAVLLLLAMFGTADLVASSAKVAVVGVNVPATWNRDVQDKLMSTNLFGVVDVIPVTTPITAQTPIPSLDHLKQYDGILLYSGSGFGTAAEADALGDRIADYLDAGGKVLDMVGTNDQASPLGGRFRTSEYALMMPGPTFSGTPHRLGSFQNVRLVATLQSFEGGSSSFFTDGALTPQANAVAVWDNDVPLMILQAAPMHNRAMLNFFPVSSDVRADLWDAHIVPFAPSVPGGALAMGATLISLLDPPAISACSFTVSQTGVSVSAIAQSAMILVTTSDPRCTWSASPAESWVHVSAIDVPDRTGTGTLIYGVDLNPGPARATTLTVAGRDVLIQQAGNNGGTNVSDFTLIPTALFAQHNLIIDTNVSAIAASPGLQWTATADAPWIHITSQLPKTGSGFVDYKVEPNPSLQRSGALTVAGLTYTIIQGGAACFFSIDSESNSQSGGGVAFTASSPGCPWTALSNSPELTITSGGSGVGNGSVAFSLAPNTTGQPRVLTLTVAMQTVSVNQPPSSTLPGFQITGPSLLSNGAVGVLYSAVQFTASGGAGGNAWSATGLPDGMTFSAAGVLGGTPASGTQGNYTPQFTVTDSASTTGSVSIGLTITTAGPPSISSVSPEPVVAAVGVQTIFINGSGFQNAAGLKVHVSNGGFQTDLAGAQVTFLSSTQLSIVLDVGTTAASWTAIVINPDAQSSNVFGFAVVVAQTTMYALPQFTFGGAWYTALYLSNPTNASVHITVDFRANDGSPLVVPLAGMGAFSSQALDLNPHSTVILEALNGNGNQVEGWAEIGLRSGATGYAVFRQVVPGRADQEAVVPLTREDSQTTDLTYDNTAFVTAVAFLNPTPNPATVTITTFDAAGAQSGTTQQVLGPRSKLSTVLQSLPGLSNIANVRGRAVFSVQSGAVSVLGLRFGGSAFTSIPVVHRPAVAETRTITYALPQFVFGGAWYTALYFSNTTSGPLSVQTRFVADNGSALSSPLVGLGSVTSQTVNLAGGATATLEALNGGTSGQGWVEATLPSGVTGYAVFRQVIPSRENQEALVPLTSESNQAADLVYDDTAFDTSVAFLNPSDQQTTVTITIHNATGSQTGITQVALAPRTKTATRLRDLPGLSAMLGNRGWASFSVPNGDISVLGLRFGGEAFTSIPVLHR